MTTTPPDKSPDRITPGQSLGPIEKPTTPGAGGADFQSYMQGTPASSKPNAAGGPNPLDLSRGNAFSSGPPSYNSILAQSQTVQDTLGTVKEQLNTKNLKFKRSQAHLMKNKLSDANEHIRSATGKLGIDTAPLKMPHGSNPIDRFLAYIDDGQDQVAAVQKRIGELSANGAQMTPADMMFLQVKMGLAQQEIEYSTTLLGKVIESIKTVINTQL
jgi:hypothetical protein